MTNKLTKGDMKKAGENASICSLESSKSRLRQLWTKQADKVKQGKFTCPICREVFTGLTAMGRHLKGHCT